MKPMTLRLVMVAAALGALSLAGPCLADDAAGGPPAPAAIKTSCGHVKSLSICVDYTAEAFAVLGEDFHKGGCTASNGTWAAQPCPTERRRGQGLHGSQQRQVAGRAQAAGAEEVAMFPGR